MSEGLIVGASSFLLGAGAVLAAIKFQGQRLDEYRKATQQDLNGLGRKERSIMAEVIIQAAITAGLPDNAAERFAVLVRKLINGI